MQCKCTYQNVKLVKLDLIAKKNVRTHIMENDAYQNVPAVKITAILLTGAQVHV